MYTLWLRQDFPLSDRALAHAEGSDFWTDMYNWAAARYGEDYVYYTFEPRA